MNLLFIDSNKLFDVSMWLAFIDVIFTAILEIRKPRRITFINAVTEAWKEYLKDLRSLVSRFAYLASCLTPSLEELKEVGY